MSLASGIAKRHKDLFVLDDDGLRRIEGVLAKAAKSYAEPLKITYHVEREDDRFFETYELDEVLADANVKGRRIKLLAIELRKEISPEKGKTTDADRVAFVIFDKDEPPFQEPDVRIRISSPDKTWALMLADELEPQITRVFKLKKFPAWVFYLFAPLFGLAIYRASNYLGNQSPNNFLHAIAGGAIFILGTVIARAYNTMSAEKSWIYKNFACEPVFLWGEEVSAFNEREALRKNLFWAVLVGFFVSLMASAAFLLF